MLQSVPRRASLFAVLCCSAEALFLERVNDGLTRRVAVTITGGGYTGQRVDVTYSSLKRGAARHQEGGGNSPLRKLPQARFQLPAGHQAGFLEFLRKRGFVNTFVDKDFCFVDMDGHPHTLQSSDLRKKL